MPQNLSSDDRIQLKRLIGRGRAIVDDLQNAQPKLHWNDLERWHAVALQFIKHADASLVDEVRPLSVSDRSSDRYGALTSALLALNAIQDTDTDTRSSPGAASNLTPADAKLDSKTMSKSIFVVHGHDEAMKLHVARFIAQLGLNPVILHEQTNQGRTIIEKFEQNAAQAGFAVVLMSPDDIGGPAAGGPEAMQRRARQNVVVELGYFTGKLGRARICVLIADKVEIPSDYMGVVYTPFDAAGGWKMALAKELKAVGYSLKSDALFD
jgi:predicted nucleotide-binding protein